jgi:type II secretory pathway component PulJ
MSRRRSRQLGFTLVQLVVGMAVMTIVTLAMAGTFVVGVRAVTTEARQISADSAISSASLTLTRDLEGATAIPIGTISSGSTLTLTYGSPSVTVVYSVNNNNALIRTAGGVARVAARGVTSVVIGAAGCYATLTIQPSATGAAAATLNVSDRLLGGCF